MPEPKDVELLRRYAEEKSEAAFGELVRRQVNLVYAIALRQCGGDAHLAEDVAQRVFTDLARKARALSGHAVLGGWLYRSAQFAASDAVRAERRRRAREQEAHAMQEISRPDSTAGDADWQKLAPVLDQAIGELGERDRDAVVLRFFEGRPFAEIGASLRLTEDAARMRVERALEKLRAALVRRGITSTTAALGVALANQAAATAPAGVAASVTGAALAGAAASGGLGTLAGIVLMGKLQTGIAVALVVASATWFLVETRATAVLSSEVEGLRANSLAWRAASEENKRLLAVATAASPSAEARTELAQWQNRVAELNAKIRPMSTGGRITMSKAEAMLHHRRSPYLAYQSVIRAVMVDDYATLADALCFDEAGQAKLQAFFAMLPKEAQAKWGTPEKLVARVFVDWRWRGDPPRSHRGGVKETPVGDDAIVEIPQTYWSGRNATERFAFKRFDDGWRHGPISSEGVNDMIALIDPTTGEPRTQPATAFRSRDR